MKHLFAKPASSLALAALLLPVAGFDSSAQVPPALTVSRSAGSALVTIAGDAGSPCTMQFATNLAAPVAWTPLTNFTLAGGLLTATDPGAATNRQRFYRALVVVPTNMLWVRAGTFVMGSPTNEAERNVNELRHAVTLTKSFFIGKFAVTQSNYLSLIGTNPSYYTPANTFTADLNRPVEQVSWADATNYCFKLTQREQAAGRIFTNWLYRLPTESEWEYACRAGTANAFYFGTNLASGMANFNGQYEYWSTGTVFNASGVFLGRTVAVGGYPPNALGLYDMAGNVWEWCQDWFGSYPTNAVTDPQGATNGSSRVFRGGSLNALGTECRSAKRNSASPSTAVNTIGFRVVLAPGP